ncbi:hypothetical protein CDES_02805 [Corynebacterium deserti GIMN1.010]|uniref:Uncharacterized protein n=1 Tax=Corynebacterium deserti GIMN1.010 TaxID=931089 RepID=A0A0M4CCL5_9CORY|nr:LppP/LprE family lipoprotein [Corynebacterium deserti]ALC05016.1 hypothetical protein CDES_02805 [Corynebacterium deserti GIMN1.010]
MITFRRLRAGITGLVGSVLLVGGISGCVSTTKESTDTTAPPMTETITVTATTPPAPPATESETTSVETTRTVGAAPQHCNLDPRTSSFGPYLAQSRAPIGELGDTPASVVPVDDWFYHFQLGENGYDSCAELSYIVLNGSNGDADRSAGTGASIADVVVLFHNGEMITAPAPFEMAAVESVSRMSDSEIEVRYGHRGGATAEGITEHYTFRFLIENGGLTGRGDLPPYIDDHLRLLL